MLWKKLTIGRVINRQGSEDILDYQKFDQATGGHWWDSVWFGFVSGCATTNHIVILIVRGKSKEEFVLFLYRFEESLWSNAWGCLWWALRKLSIEERLFKTLQSIYRIKSIYRITQWLSCLVVS